jgi:uncharacterized membrane protein YgcG
VTAGIAIKGGEKKQQGAGQPPRRRSTAPRGAPPKRRRGRRYLLGALGLVALTGFLAPSAPQADLQAVGQLNDTSLPWEVAQGWAIPALSEGAPTGAVTLTSTPAQVSDPQPATTAAISGLAANGIPNVALNAYRVAAARMDSAMPGCGIDWSLLAGIGRVESNHGRFGGATLNSDGTSTPPIKGPPLNGVQFAYIADSDGGAYDGDASYDRAVGPMQFIPTTWRAYAIDADGKGAPDPFNINDASLAAAHYLCVAGGNLTTLAGQRQAVLAYNHSDSYVAQVLSLAQAYASGIPVADLPLVGNTTGPVPPPSSGFYAAPAAPGPAIGARDMTPASGNTVGAQPAPQAANSGGSGGSSGGTPPSSGGSGGGASGGGGGGTGGGTPSGGTGGPAPQPPPQQPAQPAPQPAPAPAPVPVPAPPPAPVPVPAPPPPPPPPTELVNGLTCNVIGDLVPDIPGLPVCPA